MADGKPDSPQSDDAQHLESLQASEPQVSDAVKAAAETAWNLAQGAYDTLRDMLPQGEPSEVSPPVVNGQPTPQERVQNREAWKGHDRKTRLGEASPIPPSLGEGTEGGERSPGFDAIRGANDMAGAMVTYQNQLLTVLTTMQKVLLEGISRLEAIEAHFDRLR